MRQALLKIDLDVKVPEKWLDHWKKTRVDMLEAMGYKVRQIAFFGTRRGYHCYIRLNKFVTKKHMNELQFLLGDDQTRVKINQWRIERGVKNWNKLFHKVLYRKKPKTVTCRYCGNVIPIIERKEVK